MASGQERADHDAREAVLTLYSGELRAEIPMERIAVILSHPELIRVPGAPSGIAGVIDWKGRLISARYLEGAEEGTGFQCIVLIINEDGSLSGILADQLTGGDPIDPFYG